MKDLAIILSIVTVVGLLASVFLDRVVTPWRLRRWVEKTMQKHREGKLEPPNYDASIAWDSEGFEVREVRSGESSTRVMWKEVIKASAFKRDLFSTDRICILFASGDGHELEVHEEMNGWMPFAESLPVHLPGCKPVEAWLWDITTPAFATNLTELFSRAGAPANQRGGKC